MAPRIEGMRTVLRAKEEVAKHKLTNAEVPLTTLKEKIKADTKLADLNARRSGAPR